ncbi:ROK family protein [Segeticoccus rhizosphaerae]|uniref:ROK family protein n=1 Tax=Segeticoccus rhizosphaerae TaxID=1104777 RepID=UPI001396CB2F|nr:ROK family transcriptional regulator [Segeticoccus rhizosphaerae]
MEPGSRPSGPERPTVIISAAEVGRANRARIVQALADRGPLSRADLARITNVPRATIGSIVKSLLSSGWLEEGQPRPPADGIGKPGTPLWFGRHAGLSGAIHVQPRRVVTAVVNAAGDILSTHRHKIPARTSTEGVVSVILNAAAQEFHHDMDELTGIGLALPAAVDRQTGEVMACTPLPALVGSHLRQRLEDLTQVPTVVEEDVTTLALGQRWFGQARGVDDFAALQIGDGIGAAVMLGGHLLRSRVGLSEIGHTCVDLRGQKCTCGLIGCWETVASNNWLRHTARQLDITTSPKLTPHRLVRLATSGDKAAQGLADMYAINVAVGIANLVQFLALPVLVLHGDIVGGGEYLRSRVEQAVIARTFPAHVSGRVGQLEIQLAHNDADACLLGAAASVLSRTLHIHV